MRGGQHAAKKAVKLATRKVVSYAYHKLGARERDFFPLSPPVVTKLYVTKITTVHLRKSKTSIILNLFILSEHLRNTLYFSLVFFLHFFHVKTECVILWVLMLQHWSFKHHIGIAHIFK